ncbi:MAG: citramalate synthase [Bacteroides sp.]|nr:citramalate synthase [Prevotella sp.]MCM1408379.1 citramalate synthase [Treponema brennaborense]MCM1470390.1 citramalate synthase [Bacteroides sp.]
MKAVTIVDSTLRDGAQGEGISFSVQDKIHIARALDELGIPLIEAGNPGSNPKDLEFFREAQKIPLKHARLAAFGATRRKDISCADDVNIQGLLAAATDTVVIFGKSWDFHVTKILGAKLDENISMIYETVRYLCGAGRRVIFDAEHFFDGLKANPEYALKTIECAVRGGAYAVCLCDTKGGSLPDEIAGGVRAAKQKFGEIALDGGQGSGSAADIEIGIHTHNDCGLAVANSLAAVQAGAVHVQGTLLGIGERTGNANLSAVIANLELKMNRRCLPEGQLPHLTHICRHVAEICNIKTGNGKPYIGANAFAHKAGMHGDAVLKDPASYEHISPASVGNDRVFLLSEVSGRAMLLEKIKKFAPDIRKDSAEITRVLDSLKKAEFAGYQYEGADASFELLVRKSLGQYKPFFRLHYYKTTGELPRLDEYICSFAQLKIEVDRKIEVTAGEGDGPVHALDTALRKALERFYPIVKSVRLIDFKVRVIDSKSASAAKVRVLVESTDGNSAWTTVGVSSDIIEASWLALVDSFDYKLLGSAAASAVRAEK